jgi:exodeoxyribonuclease III
MAFRKKADFILKHKPDILIVPECEHPDKLIFSLDTPKYTDVLWFGSNQNKGLGIFSYGNFKFKLIETHNPELRMIIPISVSDGNTQFTLFAIWAYNPFDRDYKYVGQIWKAVNYYENLLKEENIIIAGDFNSNVIWDKLHRKVSHSMLVEKLESLNIFSTYHSYSNLAQGIEQHPTYFMYRHQNKPYHIDYCFVSSALLKKLDSVEIGDYNDWINYSDHVPVIATFKNTLLNRANA